MVVTADTTTEEIREALDHLWRERELYVTAEVRARLVERMDPLLDELNRRHAVG